MIVAWIRSHTGQVVDQRAGESGYKGADELVEKTIRNL